MKKIVTAVLGLGLVLGASACSDVPEMTQGQKIQVSHCVIDIQEANYATHGADHYTKHRAKKTRRMHRADHRLCVEKIMGESK